MEVVHHHTGKPRKMTTDQKERTTKVLRRTLPGTSCGGLFCCSGASVRANVSTSAADASCTSPISAIGEIFENSRT